MEETVIVALICNDSNKLFFMTSHKWKGYGLPGGKPKMWETEEEALRREVKEEIGIELTDLIKAQEIVLPPTSRIDSKTTFVVKPYYTRALTTTISPNGEVGEYGWYSIEEALQLPLLGPIRKTVEAYKLFRVNL